jgi:roadblock/LC7 domain-containing protein
MNKESQTRHKLAGFQFETYETNTRKQITTVFARFCAADQDPDNLPTTAYSALMQKDWPVKYPTLSAADIAEVLTDGMNGAPKYDVKRELAETMDATALTDILLYMKQARALYDNGNNAGESYIPLSRLLPPVL